MTADLGMIYTTTDDQHEGAELRCQEHPDWWADADGTNLPDVLGAAVDHFRDEHRVHVDDCMCAKTVLDQRCVPSLTWPAIHRF